MKTVKLVCALVALMVSVLAAAPASAARLRDGMELNRYSGNALTVILTYNVPGVGPTFEESASSDGSTKVDVPADACNIQIVGLADGRVGKLAGFQDKKPLQLLMNSSSLRRWRVLDEQSDQSQKDVKNKSDKWGGLLIANMEHQDFPPNQLVFIKFNHSYNATAPTLIVKRLPYTYEEILRLQAGAAQGVPPGAVGAEAAVVTPAVTPRAQGAVANEEDEDFDPRTYTPEDERPARTERREDDPQGRDREYRRDDRRREPRTPRRPVDEDPDEDDDLRGRRTSDRPSDRATKPRHLMPKTGKLTIVLVHKDDDETEAARPLRLDIFVNGEWFRGVKVSGDEWTGEIPAGEIDIRMAPADARGWVVGRFSVELLLAGTKATYTIKER